MALARRRSIGAGLAAGLVAIVAVAVTAGAHGSGDHVQVRAPTPTTDAPTSRVTATDAVPTSPPTTAPLPAPLAPSTGSAPPPPPWSASPTTGLTNLAPVTITARDLPNGIYVVGQCPADVGVPDLVHCAVNGRPNFITVSDGTLHSTVHVYRWVGSTHFDCASAPGACAVGFMNNSPHSNFPPVGFPITFDPARAPSITVTPTDGIVTGQAIRVHGDNVGEGLVEVEQCLELTWAACSFHEVRSAPDGSFDVSFAAQRDFLWAGHSSGSGSCDVESACMIVVWVHPPSPSQGVTWSNWATPIVLRFAPLPPSTTTTGTTTNVAA